MIAAIVRRLIGTNHPIAAPTNNADPLRRPHKPA